MDPWTKTPLCSSWVSKKMFSWNSLMYTVYSFTLGLHCLPQRQWGALKFRKPHKGNDFLSNYSETVGPILMILSADPYENWMPMKCWKNQPSSTSMRAHLSLRARTWGGMGGLVILNFWSIVLDDHWSKKIYKPMMIVWWPVLYSSQMILFIRCGKVGVTFL